MRYREIQQLTQGLPASEWQNLNPDSCVGNLN